MMVGSQRESVTLREGFVAELADAALEEISRHQVRGSSVEQELGLWKALSQVVARNVQQLRPGEGLARTRAQCEDFLASLAEAAYEVALIHGFRGPFPDVQLGLWKALRRVVREGRRAEPFFRSLCPCHDSDARRDHRLGQPGPRLVLA